MINSDDYIYVGKIGKSVGLDGCLNLVSLTSFPERFNSMKEFFLTKDRAIPLTLQIEKIMYNNNKISVKFKDINSIKDAEKLKDYRITVHKSERYPLPEDYHFVDDLKECYCYDQNDNEIGFIKDVMESAGNDIYIIDYKGKEVLVPVIEEFVKEIDINAKRIKLNLINGMLPDDEN